MKITLQAAMVLFLCLLMILTGCNTVAPIEEQELKDLPTPEPGKSLIYGQALNAETNQPVGGSIFLAENLTASKPELPATISFSFQSNPSAVYNDDTGNFYFNDITPGSNYVLIIHYGPGGMIVLKEDNSEVPLVIEVEADQILDLGTITISEP
jgi:hypothetical protein